MTPRKCGAGCGRLLRRGQARLAYVMTVLGGMARATVCTSCARRGVLLVSHLDEPALEQRLPSRPARHRHHFEADEHGNIQPCSCGAWNLLSD